MLESAERVMFAKRHDGYDTRHHVQQESSKVADKSDNHQALGNDGREIVTENSEAVPDVLRQRFYRVVAQSGGTAEVEENRHNGDEHRNRCQRPDRTMRSQFG